MKLKNLLGKAVVVGAVAVATMVMGAVAVFAEPVSTIYNFADITNEGLTAEKYSGSALTKTSTDTTLTFNEEKSNTITVIGTLNSYYITYAGSSISLSSVTGNNLLTGESLNIGFGNNSGGNGNKALIGISSIKAYDKIEVYWTASSNTAGKPSGSGTISFRDGNNTGSTLSTTSSITSNNDITCSSYIVTKDMDNIYICPSSRAVIFAVIVTTGNEAPKVATVSGTISDKLAASGEILFTAADGSSATATIENGSYTATLNQNTEYKISLDNNDDYFGKSRYTLGTTSVTVGTDEAQTCNISEDTFITEWNFKSDSSLPSVTASGKDYKYKGLIIDISNGGKFASRSDDVQINASTTVKVPLDNPTDKVSYTIGSQGTFSLRYYSDYAIIKCEENGYLKSIKVENKTTPALSLSASGNTLTGTIYNAAANNEIKNITVKKADATTTTGNITKVAKDGDNYKFVVKVNNTTDSAVDANVVFEYGSTTIDYGFNISADNVITTTA